VIVKTKSRKIKWVVHGALCTVHVGDTRYAAMILVWKTESSSLAYHMKCKVWFELTQDWPAFVIEGTTFLLLLILLRGTDRNS